MLIKVRLNGTDINPYHMYGLTRNPFPKHGRVELNRLDEFLSILAAGPMPQVEDLIRVLNGLKASEEFKAICIQNYRSGVMVEFELLCPDL